MLHSQVSNASLRIVKLLVGQPPMAISELIDATGVTRTAITEQLNELVAAGYVRRTVEPCSGRGRPRHLYSLTRQAMHTLFDSDHGILVPAIQQAIVEIGGNELLVQIIHRAGRVISDNYMKRISADDPVERLRQLSELMQEDGIQVEMNEKDGVVTFCKRSCPFISMYNGTDFVCGIDREVLSNVVGAPLQQIESRHDDASACCAFELVAAKKAV